jgi:hypothetical protein
VHRAKGYLESVVLYHCPLLEDKKDPEEAYAEDEAVELEAYDLEPGQGDRAVSSSADDDIAADDLSEGDSDGIEDSDSDGIERLP